MRHRRPPRVKVKPIPGSAPDGGVSPRIARLASNAKALGSGWKGSPLPIKVTVWALTWIVVGAITWAGAQLGLLPDADHMGALLRVVGEQLP